MNTTMKIARITKGLSQYALGREVNTSQPIISRIERYHDVPDPVRAAGIARVLEIPISTLHPGAADGKPTNQT